MREKVRDRGRIEHMIEAIDYIASFVDGLTFEEFATKPMVYFAVVKNIEIIGEAAYMLTKEFTASHKDIDWPVIIRMRHVLVHGYYQLEKDEMWTTATIDVPALKPQLEHLLQQMGRE